MQTVQQQQAAQQQDAQAVSLMLLGNCNVRETLMTSKMQQDAVEKTALAAYWSAYVAGLSAEPQK